MSKRLTKKEVTVYEHWLATNDSNATMAKRFKIKQDRVEQVIKQGSQDFQSKFIGGELAVSDYYIGTSSFRPIAYNPNMVIRSVGWERIEEMRRDDQVKAALVFKKHAVIGSGWSIEAQATEVAVGDGTGEKTVVSRRGQEIAEFVRDTLIGMESSLATTLFEIMSAMDFGYSVSEKVWDKKDGKVILKAVKTKKPRWISFDVDPFGNLLPDGIIQSTERGEVRLPVEKFVVWTYNPEFGNKYGTPDLEAAYRGWWQKRNAYSYLAMLLERFGIPPIFAIYNPSLYSSQTQDKLYAAVKTIQAGTSGIIPRGNKDALEFWSPQGMGKGVSDIFIPAIDRYDQDIARGLLMPGLLGFTSDSSQGSYARAQVQFDVFMMLINYLKQEISERVVMEQMIRPLVDLNFAISNPHEYPLFTFDPLNDDKRLEMMKAWGVLVGQDVVMPQDADEAHIREQFEFPPINPKDVRRIKEKIPEPAPMPEPEEEHPEEGAEEEHDHVSRPLEGYERKVDFQSIEDGLNYIDREHTIGISNTLSDVRDRFMKFFDGQDAPTLRMASELKTLRGMPEVRGHVKIMMIEAFELGERTVKDDLKRAPDTEAYALGPNYTPIEALKYMDQKSFFITGLMEDDLLDSIRGIIYQGIESGISVNEMRKRIKDAFGPYIADPSIDAINTPHRLNTIVRTNTTDALNRGRLVWGRQAGRLLKGFAFSAVLDERTSTVCRFLDGKVFQPDDPNLDRLKPPRHFNCRSILVPITIGEQSGPFITGVQSTKGIEGSGKGFR